MDKKNIINNSSEIRELNVDEIEAVNGAGTDWNAVGSTIALVGIAVGAAATAPVTAAIVATGAAGMGIFSAWSSWQSSFS